MAAACNCDCGAGACKGAVTVGGCGSSTAAGLSATGASAMGTTSACFSARSTDVCAAGSAPVWMQIGQTGKQPSENLNSVRRQQL